MKKMNKILLGGTIAYIVLYGLISVIPPNSFQFLKSSAIGEPSATLTINKKTDLQVHPGDSIVFEWATKNADEFTTTTKLTGGTVEQCGQSEVTSKSVKKANGKSRGMIKVPSGCSYHYIFTAKNTSTGKIATSTVQMTVINFKE